MIEFIKEASVIVVVGIVIVVWYFVLYGMVV